MPWSHGKKLSKRHSDKINDPEIWKAKHTETNVSREQAQAKRTQAGMTRAERIITCGGTICELFPDSR